MSFPSRRWQPSFSPKQVRGRLSPKYCLRKRCHHTFWSRYSFGWVRTLSSLSQAHGVHFETSCHPSRRSLTSSCQKYLQALWIPMYSLLWGHY